MKEPTKLYGDPDVRLEGLRIWIHNRAYPECNDKFDGNWLIATVDCRSTGSAVQVYGTILHLSELSTWKEDLIRLNETLKGEAELNCIEPYMHANLIMDSSGRISFEVELTPDHLNQEHSFIFDIDQSYLNSIIGQLSVLINKYPLKK